MTRSRVIAGRELYVAVGRVIVAIMAVGLGCSVGCWRSSPSVSAPKGGYLPAPQQTGPQVNGKPQKSATSNLAAAPAKEAVPAESGEKLYARHCAACHGNRGDGKGIAATFLFPKPRDFRAGRFRLVSTSNNVPTREDLQAVLLRGMPGSAMPSWAHLSQQERDALVDEILRFRVEGAREAVVNRLKEDEGMSDAEIAASADAQKVIQEEIKSATTSGEVRAVPNIGPPTEKSVAEGKANYAKYGCISCHGATGRGDGQQDMVDDEKMPTRPRDFTLGIFKGNPDPTSLYRRIASGMPGTPMPSSSAMTPQQMVDLVHYIRSLSTEEQRQA
ncbi:MAG TPA: cytochrome c, partial [Lacipirellulaceae bacterium]|nr:cytochrome c [Lacipirellulaceae bacterium]